MGKIFSALRIVAIGMVALALSAQMALANDVIGLDGRPVEGPYGFLGTQAAQEQLLELMAPIAPLTANGAPNTTTINQVGVGLVAHSSIEGQSNLSYISQTGSNNRAVQAISGNNSALLLDQSGNGNSVLQASVGNENFQMVGVSGQGNEVAYVQAGNELAGALQVGGRNSSVMAIQTEASGRYLMPVGLNGLRNQVVVVVPGRMYVFNK